MVLSCAQTTVVFETECGKQVVGHAVRAEGKETGVKITQGGFRGVASIKSVRVVGREEQTNAERARDAFVLRALKGAFTSLTESPFVKMLWFPDPTPRDRGAARRASVSPRIDDDQEDEGERFGDVFNGLNPSQKGVVRAMWSTEPLVVAHGMFLIPRISGIYADAPTRSSWNRENVYHRGSARGAEGDMGNRAVKRRSQEHRAHPCEGEIQDRLQDTSIEGVLCRMVSHLQS